MSTESKYAGKKYSEIFESVVCPRCEGTGKHSFNLVDGDVCYGCHGVGSKFTKRGQDALNYLHETMSILTDEVKVGDSIRKGMLKIKVDQIRRDDSFVYFDSAPNKFGRTQSLLFPFDEKVIKLRTAIENEPLIDAALAYQETLTEKGKVRKYKKGK